MVFLIEVPSPRTGRPNLWLLKLTMNSPKWVSLWFRQGQAKTGSLHKDALSIVNNSLQARAQADHFALLGILLICLLGLWALDKSLHMLPRRDRLRIHDETPPHL